MIWPLTQSAAAAASTTDAAPDKDLENPALVYEPKFDGIRALVSLEPATGQQVWVPSAPAQQQQQFVQPQQIQPPAPLGQPVPIENERSQRTLMDLIFGDQGNDWLVGGTGRDDLWGGWGTDLLQADDFLGTTDGGTADNAPDTSREKALTE